MTVALINLGDDAWEAAEPGHLLHGIQYLESIAYDSPRAKALFDAFGLEPLEGQGADIGELPDGRWALVGTLIPGSVIALEEAEPVHTVQAGARLHHDDHALLRDVWTDFERFCNAPHWHIANRVIAARRSTQEEDRT